MSDDDESRRKFWIAGRSFWNERLWYIERNYLLFGLLANVGYESIRPLIPERGLPKDISQELKSISEELDVNRHNSYTTLSELLQAKHTKLSLIGYVDIKNYLSFKNNGYPDCWSFGTFSGNIIDNNEMERRSKLISFHDNTFFVTQITFKYPICKIAGKDFWTDLVGKMQLIDHNPNNVRMIFWFDI